MSHVALHSLLLTALITIYIVVLFNAFLGYTTIDVSLGHLQVNNSVATNSSSTVKISTTTISSVPVADPELFIGIVIYSVTYVLHSLCLLICSLALVFNDVAFCALRIPPLMLPVLLGINGCFNLVGVIMLGLSSRPMDNVLLTPAYSIPLRSICGVSGCAVLLCCIQIGLTVKFPARKVAKNENSKTKNAKKPEVGAEQYREYKAPRRLPSPKESEEEYRKDPRKSARQKSMKIESERNKGSQKNVKDSSRKNESKKDGSRKDNSKKDILKKEKFRKESKKDGSKKNSSMKDCSRKDGSKKETAKKDISRMDGSKKSESRKEKSGRDSENQKPSQKSLNRKDSSEKKSSEKGSKRSDKSRKMERNSKKSSIEYKHKCSEKKSRRA